METRGLVVNAKTPGDYLALFLQSRQAMEVSPGTLNFYKIKLGRFLSELNPGTAQRQDIEKFLVQFDNPGNRHAYYRAIKTFYNWCEETFGLPNPMKHMKAPKLPKLILPSLTKEQVITLINSVDNRAAGTDRAAAPAPAAAGGGESAARDSPEGGRPHLRPSRRQPPRPEHGAPHLPEDTAACRYKDH